MSPQVPALPRSDSKARLLSHIGLDMENNIHRRAYTLMKLEASEGRKRIIAVLDARAAMDGSTPSGRPTSYTTSQVDEEIMDEEVRRIYHTAQPTTRTLYDLAVDPQFPERPNWIIRWMLWHVFRYRDGRQAQKAVVGATDGVGNDDGSPSPTSPSQVAMPVTMTRGSVSDGHCRGYFDPVRGRYRN
ncbi:hypothetical protein CERZMDRAFT_94899 [Cercospora zeae-maydis SCOH1-5]|uniref:Uncharacterized protein n=1 Tax=Cercospora zeae-maydis SCOH1-5 TaxID=717836 RepID=A0A6A6FQC3_9PEZI|nr:hypothetical protein CERZMDRAFT_94899 [Cercospora zeae-maydis SCOH1-5]